MGLELARFLLSVAMPPPSVYPPPTPLLPPLLVPPPGSVSPRPCSTWNSLLSVLHDDGSVEGARVDIGTDLEVWLVLPGGDGTDVEFWLHDDGSVEPV